MPVYLALNGLQLVLQPLALLIAQDVMPSPFDATSSTSFPASRPSTFARRVDGTLLPETVHQAVRPS